MKKLVGIFIILLSVLGWNESMGQSNHRPLGTFPAASLKWIHAAEPTFGREKLDLDKYNISVIDEGDSVTVSLTSVDCVEGSHKRGSCGTYPGFVVTVSKKDKHVVRSNYVR